MAVLISVISLLGLGVQYVQVRAEFDRSLLAELQTDLDGYSAIYEQRRIISVRQAMEFRAQLQPGLDRVFLLQDKKKQFLAGNIAHWPNGLIANAGGFGTRQTTQFKLTGDDGITRGYIGVALDLPGGFPMLLAHSTHSRAQLLANMRWVILMFGLVMLALSGASGWVVSRIVIGRIDRVNALADRVVAGNLKARITGQRSNDEFGRLESHVHAMLDRIEALQQATFRLSDNIAHELRTPLNRIRQKLDQLTGQEDLVDALNLEIANAIRVFESLLDIAAAEAATGSKPGLVLVSLSETCESVFQLYEPLAEDRGLTFTRNLVPDLWVLGDGNLIAQLLSNLVDNALKFTPEGESVTLELSTNAGTHHLVISDTGPGLPDDLLDRVFDRFSRAERDRAISGHGLGLALVQAIATRHGAKLSILNREKGFAVETMWPMVSPPKPPTRIEE